MSKFTGGSCGLDVVRRLFRSCEKLPDGKPERGSLSMPEAVKIDWDL
jgi:hypothetical protein